MQDLMMHFNLNKGVVVFGTGFAGKLVMYLLKCVYHKPVICSFDNSIIRQKMKFWDEIECRKPELLDENVIIMICVFNGESVVSIKKQCEELGYKTILTLSETQIISATMNMEEKECVEVMYYCATDEKLDLDNPVKYNEKLQWLKVYDHNPLYKTMVDKLSVKEYVRSRIGDDYIVPTLGVWDSFDEIDFDKLPCQFVLKCTHDSGSAVIVNNKAEMDYMAVRGKINKALSMDYYYAGREYGYKGIPRKIIAEPKLNGHEKKDIKDYKVFTFAGVPRMVQVDYNRFTNHTRIMYSVDWENLGFSTLYPYGVNDEEKKPLKLDELLRIAEILAEGLIHARVDFYIVDNRIYFGEFTFHHGGGYEKFSDESWNYKMGEWLILPDKQGYLNKDNTI